MVAEAAMLAGYNIAGFIDQSSKTWNTMVLGIPVLGDESILESSQFADCDLIIAIGDNECRALAVQRLSSRDQGFATIVHPSAVISPSAALGEGTVVLAGAVLNSMVRVGAHCIVNTMVSIDHDCSLADFVHISPGVHLAGDCHIGEVVHIGIGACMLPGLSVGARSTIGAGSVVTTDIPGDAVAMGVPAKVKS